jgi:hypothetical protein
MDKADTSKLPKALLARAVLAKNIAIKNPAKMDVDNDLMPWSFDDKSCLWVSFDGHYSYSSPEQKRANEVSREEREEQLKEIGEQKAVEMYANNLYWSKVRADVLKRDKYTCQVCGSKATTKFHVHHIMKRKEGGTDHYDSLLCVCNHCHGKADNGLYDPEWVKLSPSPARSMLRK